MNFFTFWLIVLFINVILAVSFVGILRLRKSTNTLVTELYEERQKYGSAADAVYRRWLWSNFFVNPDIGITKISAIIFTPAFFVPWVQVITAVILLVACAIFGSMTLYRRTILRYPQLLEEI